MPHAFVTGAAGFIGSNLVDGLLAQGWQVTGWDNFSTGQEEFLTGARKDPGFRLVQGDVLDLPALTAAMAGADTVFHLAANADVRFGLDHPGRDLEQNTVATFRVLEAIRANNIRRLVFSSTGSVYGECAVIPTPENAPFPVQTSLYAASKLSGEGMIQAYAEGFGLEAWIFRFVSILGERYTHGHIFDFCRQLREHPNHLRVLGDGSQRKSYLYVGDCIAAILHLVGKGHPKPDGRTSVVYNLGTDSYCRLTDSISWITRAMNLSPRLEFTGGERGWVGDNPFIFLDTSKVRATGWTPRLSIEQAVVSTVSWLKENAWVLERRLISLMILITGSSSGIGRMVAEALVAEGHSVIGIARRAQQPVPGPGTLRSFQADVTSSLALNAIAETIESDGAHLDAIICCAGVQGQIGSALDTDPDEWIRTVDINLGGTFRTVHAFASLLADSRRAKIICLSGGGASGPRPHFSAYAAAKTGVVRLVETLAAEWQEKPIDITALAPGAISTDMTAEVIAAGPSKAGESEYQQALKIRDGGDAPCIRLLDCVRFLLSPASDGLTGKLISAQWDDWSNFPRDNAAWLRPDAATLRRVPFSS